MVTGELTTTRTQREDTAQPYSSDGNYTTTQTNQNHQHATTIRERPRKNSRILRTHHHDPRPPRILTQVVIKSRCSSGRTFEGVLRRSFLRERRTRRQKNKTRAIIERLKLRFSQRPHPWSFLKDMYEISRRGEDRWER